MQSIPNAILTNAHAMLTNAYVMLTSAYAMLTNVYVRGHSQNTLTARGEGGAHEVSTLLDKHPELYQVKLSTRGVGVKKAQKFVNVVCERPHTSSYHL